MDSLWPTARTSREDCCTSCLSPGICWYLRSTITAEVGNCLTGRGRLTWLNFCLLFTGLAGLLMFSFQLPLHFWMAVISGAILCWYKSPLPFCLHTKTAICWILFGTMLECWQRWSFVCFCDESWKPACFIPETLPLGTSPTGTPTSLGIIFFGFVFSASRSSANFWGCIGAVLFALLWWILEASLFPSWNTTIGYLPHRNTILIRHHFLCH